MKNFILTMAVCVSTVFAKEEFFPKDTFSGFETEWFSQALSGLKERPLMKLENDNLEVIRLTNLPSFTDDMAITARADSRGHFFVSLKKASKDPGAFAKAKAFVFGGRLTLEKSKEISQNDWKKAVDLEAAANFWNLSPNEKVIGMDGTRWILEGSRTSSYHCISRFSPTEGPIFELGTYLAQLAGAELSRGR